tara:strand:- start:2798 stop:3721 length:924 start_codon:yes stop_codon:yes gene_type:complete
MSETVTTTDKGTASTVIFFVITLIFFTAKYIFVDKKYSVDNLKYILGKSSDKPSKKGALDAIITVAYFAIIIIIQISINSQTILDKCKGYTQPIGVLFSTTIIPNVLILGLIYFVITLMPSWKYPFSYVFGMVSSKLRKAWESLRHVPKDGEAKKTPLLMKVWTKAFGTESTKFIKKITKENFTEFFRKAFENDGLLKKPDEKTKADMITICENEDNIEYVTALNDEARMKVVNIQDKKLFEKAEKTYNSIKSIYQYVMRKDLVAQCIWFLLAGFLLMNVTQDTISSIECEYTAEQLREISNRQAAD